MCFFNFLVSDNFYIANHLSGRSAGEGIGYPLWLFSGACSAGDLGSIPGVEDPPEKGTALQYSGLENSMDCIVHGVTKSRTLLSDFHFHFFAKKNILQSFQIPSI